MNEFQYKGRQLYCEEVPVREIAEKLGTPLYIYSCKTIENHYKVFDSAFNRVPHIVSYSVKANSNLAILRMLFSYGCGADVVSGGELYRALHAGVNPKKVVFSGVGKTVEEMKMAIEAGILMFNVESDQEMRLLNDIAGKMRTRAPVSLRVNPNIDAGTHPYISTGLKENKFGIPIEMSLRVYREARSLKHLDVIGIDCHIGSQITDLAPFVSALRTMKKLLRNLRKEKCNARYLDVGGGLGISYNNETPPNPRDYAEALIGGLGDEDITLILEPGRVLMGNAGILVSRVLYAKHTPSKKFIIVDTGMNDLLRPSLYNSYQEILPVERSGRSKITADIVGPICESTDFIARKRKVPVLKPGELIAIMSAGAYGFTMSSNYNSRPRAAEVLVKGDNYSVIRKRESYRDLVRGEDALGD